jgi:chloramphenicol-sensitive protein RarD
VNWLVYVWAVNSDFIVEASLGYFINPLVNVLLGVVVLKERLSPWQWLPIGLAGVGVLYLGYSYGRIPWIALTLAFSFGFYGLVKKISPIGPVQGMFSEMTVLFLPALGFLIFSDLGGGGAFAHTGLVSDLLMIGAGPATTIPLLLFAGGAQRIPLSLMGVLQYLAPTLQFLIGVFVFLEPVPVSRWIGFAIIWAALVIFAVEGWQAGRDKAIVPTV